MRYAKNIFYTFIVILKRIKGLYANIKKKKFHTKVPIQIACVYIMWEICIFNTQLNNKQTVVT